MLRQYSPIPNKHRLCLAKRILIIVVPPEAHDGRMSGGDV
jgi:hypothetical protein